MGLLTLPFRLPFLPVQGVIRLAELIQEEAEQQLHDPGTVRDELEEAERLHAAGEISDDELAQREQEALSRLTNIQNPLDNTSTDRS